MTTSRKSGTGRTGRRLAAAAAALGLAVFPATTALAQDGSASPAARKIFTVGIMQDIDSMNPFAAYLSSAYEAQGVVYDLLTGWSEQDFSASPQLADSWSHTDDGLQWTFKIHPGVKWSDGQPLTAKDVAYTFNRVVNGEVERSFYDSYVKNITNVIAVDDVTAEFHLSQPDPIMEHLWVPVLPEHVWKDISEDEVGTFANDKDVVGSGPFVLAERKVGEFTRFLANKNYFMGAPKIDELVLRVFKNEDAMVQALRKGEIDAIADLGATAYLSLQDVPGITTVNAHGLAFNEIGFNVGAANTDNVPLGDGHPALKDPAVRRAISHAIDRNTLIEKVWRGLGQPGTGIIPPDYADIFYTPAADEVQNFDLAKANALLDEAGYPRGSDGIRVDPNGKKMEMRLFGREDSPESQQSVQYVQGWLKEIGIDAKLTIMAEDKLTDVIGNGEYDMFEWGWGVEPDPNFQLSTMTCDQRSTGTGDDLVAGWSDSFYCNPAYDELYAQQGTELDRPKRAEIIKQMQKMVYDDAPYAVTYYTPTLQAYRSDRWTGFIPDASGTLIYQYGTYSYRNIDRPTEGDGSGGLGTGVLIGVGVAAAALIVAGGVAFTRRRAGADERE